MNIAPLKVTVREVVTGYVDESDREEGVKRTYDISEMHADHVKPWHLGGKTEIENGRMLCAAHNLAKGGVW